MKKTTIIFIGVTLLMFSLFGCGNLLGIKGKNGIGRRGKPNDSDLVGFHYSYDGTIGGNNYRYDIDDGVFTYEAMDNNYGELSAPVGDDLLKKLKDIYLANKVYQWDGFSKYATNVSDGDGFSVSFRFADGESCSAHGSNAYPEGYGAFSSDMEAVIGPFVKQLIEAKRAEIISTGISGKAVSCLMFFKQQGSSGSDEYSFHVYHSDNENSSNFDLSIRSVSGEFIEEGDYRLYGHLDSEYIDLTWLDELIRKYDIITWYEYDEAAQDYSNSEWFQMNLGLDDENVGTISAMGTRHPENYDEFRKEFLTQLVSFYEEVKDKVR